jgi:hypothetical protein
VSREIHDRPEERQKSQIGAKDKMKFYQHDRFSVNYANGMYHLTRDTLTNVRVSQNKTYSHPAFAIRESCDIHEANKIARNQYFSQLVTTNRAPAVVEDTLLSPTLGGLLLFLLFDLGGLGLDFASTGERSVNYMPKSEAKVSSNASNGQAAIKMTFSHGVLRWGCSRTSVAMGRLLLYSPCLLEQ